jgi:DinB superfamily
MLDPKGTFMNRTLLAAALAALALPCAAQMSMPMPATAPLPPTTGPAGEVLRSYTTLKPNVIKAAEKMPEADFKYMPTPDIRTYARIINHITEAQFRSCGILNGKANSDIAKPPSDTADKATIVAALKASFDECDKAYAALTDANVTEMMTLGQNKRSRIGMAWGNVSHDNEQYAELSTYLRLKGLVPPTSEK